MKKIWLWLKLAFTYLAYGMKKTEQDILTTKGLKDDVDCGIEAEVTDQRVSKALLKGELTQAVKELRYRTYKVDAASRFFEYYSPTLTHKREKLEQKMVAFENSDKRELIVIQPNFTKTESLLESMERIERHEERKEEYYLYIGREYDFSPRFPLEKYATKAVVFKGDDEEHAVVDFYVSKYANPDLKVSKAFISEVERVKNTGKSSDITDISELTFMTLNAYGVVDMFLYTFKDFKFMKVLEFDGSYVIRFECRIDVNGDDMTKEYYCKEMDEKYKTNAPKDFVLDITNTPVVREYVCAECGKVVKYDTTEINALEPVSLDELDDQEERSGVTEYMDMEMSEQTFGKRLCKDCLEKKLNSLKSVYEKRANNNK